MRAGLGVAVAALLALGSATPARAISIGLHEANQGISSLSYTISGSTIDIYETWTSVGAGILEISGLGGFGTYTVNKHIINETGLGWDRFALELLDLAGGINDSVYDATQPAWVPDGYSTSNDSDGLSFAQGSTIPRTSAEFEGLLSDEESDARDFLDFYNGWLSGEGGTDLVGFGLRNVFGESFLLVQRPNESSVQTVPEPGSLALLALGLGTAACVMRRRDAAVRARR